MAIIADWNWRGFTINIYEKLTTIQAELKAPKSRRNTFGNYNYRSCEDILEAAKPLLAANLCSLTLDDEVISVGTRIYVKATATLTDHAEGTSVSTHAFAREAETKKGMDESQITGTASSYARKYALNGLFAIDDAKDADTDEYQNSQKQSNTRSTARTQTGFKCSVCNKDVTPVSFDGKNYSARAIAEQTTKKMGRCMCGDCYMKAAQNG